jgi:hypothetical protein
MELADRIGAHRALGQRLLSYHFLDSDAGAWVVLARHAAAFQNL